MKKTINLSQKSIKDQNAKKERKKKDKLQLSAVDCNVSKVPKEKKTNSIDKKPKDPNAPKKQRKNGSGLKNKVQETSVIEKIELVPISIEEDIEMTQ